VSQIALRAYRVELDLTTTQRRWCERACAATRVAYNWGLSEWRRWYRWDRLATLGKQARAIALIGRWQGAVPTYQGKPSAYGVHARLTVEKKGKLAWMHEIENAYVTREAIGALGKGYEAFFRRLKKHAKGDHSECGKGRRGSCSLGIPRFHARRPDEGFVCDQGNAIKSGMEDGRGWIAVSGLGKIYAKRGQALPAAAFVRQKKVGSWVGDPGVALCGVSIRRYGGRWFAALRAHAPVHGRARSPGSRMSVEVGVRYRAVTFDGDAVGTFRDTRESAPSARKIRYRAFRKWAEALFVLDAEKLLPPEFPRTLLRVVLKDGGKLTPKTVGIFRKAVLELSAPKAMRSLRALDAEFGAALPLDASHGTERLERLERIRNLWERRMARRWKNGKKTRDQSRGWHEARAKVAMLHRKSADLRADRIHFTSRAIVNAGKAELVVRDMEVKDLLQRGAVSDPRARNVLAPSVHAAGMAELRRQLEYKQAWAGGTTVVTGPDTESRVCSACGEVRDAAPSYPSFVCPSCGHSEDRDTNAARVRFDHRTPSGDPEASPGTRGLKGGRGKPRAHTTAARTGPPGPEDPSSGVGPDGSSESSAPPGSGNGAARGKPSDEKPRKRRPRTPGMPGAKQQPKAIRERPSAPTGGAE
jgi:predicted RNA-binding Zn-ribbon protein involved in translation (DUF1610 family)